MANLTVFDKEVVVGVGTVRAAIPKGHETDQLRPITREERNFVRYTVAVGVLCPERAQHGFVFFDRLGHLKTKRVEPISADPVGAAIFAVGQIRDLVHLTIGSSYSGFDVWTRRVIGRDVWRMLFDQIVKRDERTFWTKLVHEVTDTA